MALFSLYLVYDVQMCVGSEKFGSEYSVDNYVYAALNMCPAVLHSYGVVTWIFSTCSCTFCRSSRTEITKASLCSQTQHELLVVLVNEGLFLVLLRVGRSLRRLANKVLLRLLSQHPLLLVHLTASHQRVHEGAQQHQRSADARAQRHGVAKEEVGDEGLDAGLGRTGDVVREGRGEADLGDGHDADQEAEDAGQVHHEPEGERDEGLGMLANDVPLEDEDHGDEEDGGVHVVLDVREGERRNIEAQFPGIVLHDGNHLLGVDTVQRHEKRRKHAKNGAQQREVDLAVSTHVKPIDHNQAAADDGQRGSNAQKQVTSREANPAPPRKNDVEDDGQGAGDQIERNVHISTCQRHAPLPLQTEIIKGDHSDENDGERKNADGRVDVVLLNRELSQERV